MTGVRKREVRGGVEKVPFFFFFFSSSLGQRGGEERSGAVS
jgi:hypothetical protein